MSDLFNQSKPDLSKLQLSEFKGKKKAEIKKEKAKKVARLNKISNEAIPPFKSEELRKKLFPTNPPLTLKQLKIKKYGKR